MIMQDRFYYFGIDATYGGKALGLKRIKKHLTAHEIVDAVYKGDLFPNVTKNVSDAYGLFFPVNSLAQCAKRENKLVNVAYILATLDGGRSYDFSGFDFPLALETNNIHNVSLATSTTEECLCMFKRLYIHWQAELKGEDINHLFFKPHFLIDKTTHRLLKQFSLKFA